MSYKATAAAANPSVCVRRNPCLQQKTRYQYMPISFACNMTYVYVHMYVYMYNCWLSLYRLNGFGYPERLGKIKRKLPKTKREAEKITRNIICL